MISLTRQADMKNAGRTKGRTISTLEPNWRSVIQDLEILDTGLSPSISPGAPLSPDLAAFQHPSVSQAWAAWAYRVVGVVRVAQAPSCGATVVHRAPPPPPTHRLYPGTSSVGRPPILLFQLDLVPVVSHGTSTDSSRHEQGDPCCCHWVLIPPRILDKEQWEHPEYLYHSLDV